MWKRRDAALNQLKGRSELCTTASFPPVIFGSTTEHQRNKPPADTTVGSAKEETTTDIHFHPSKHSPSVPGTQEEAHSGCLVGIK